MILNGCQAVKFVVKMCCNNTSNYTAFQRFVNNCLSSDVKTTTPMLPSFSCFILSAVFLEEKGAELETQIQEEEELINKEIQQKEKEKRQEKSVDMRLCNGEMFWIKSVSQSFISFL